MATQKVVQKANEVDPFLEFMRDYFGRDDARPKSHIASEAGISRMYLHDLISGNNSDPSLAVAMRLAKAMGTTLEKILKKTVSHA